jgi:hypothetical protein
MLPAADEVYAISAAINITRLPYYPNQAIVLTDKNLPETCARNSASVSSRSVSRFRAMLVAERGARAWSIATRVRAQKYVS